MKSSVMRFLLIFLCTLCLYFLASYIIPLLFGEEEITQPEPEVITAFNQPFENDNIKVTFTEIHAYENTYKPERGDLRIYANYTVENMSDRTFIFSWHGMSVYADDIAVENSTFSVTLAPGKKADLICETYAFKDTQHIEIYLDDPISVDKHVVTFQLDIPPIEESTTAS